MASEIVEVVPVVNYGVMRIDSDIDAAMAFHPLPPEHAYAEIADDGDPILEVGNVVRVDMRTTNFIAEAAYAMEIDGMQVVRRIRADTKGLCVFWGENTEPFDSTRMGIIGIVDAKFSTDLFI